MALGDHRGRNERRKHSAHTVESVQEAEYLVGIGHVADPGIPGCVCEPVAEPGDREDDDEDGVRRVHGNDDVGDEVADGC
jgi:hypothetical protein